MDQHDQQYQQKHVCKVCDRTFPCGQSLGGHMRTHAMNLVVTSETNDVTKSSKLSSFTINNIEENGDTSQLHFQQNSNTHMSYVLRENPKKTNRFTRLRKEVLTEENLCKLCGKGFQSSKALFGHMKCHSEKVVVYTTIEDQISSESDRNEEVDPSSYSRRGSKRMTRNNISCPSENEQEDIAKCLMMLSRDDWSTKDKLGSDKAHVAVGSKENGDKMSSKEICSDEVYSDKKAVYNADEQVFKERASKRIKFQCNTCKKIFHSYQALGGHRASHKKIKGCYASKITQVLETSSEQAHYASTRTESNLTIKENQELYDPMPDETGKGKSKDHKCPFCPKVFSSGQALGGHKRSHYLNSSSFNANQGIVIEEPMANSHDMLDLNLPAPTEDSSTPSQVTEFSKPWWGPGSCSKPESPIPLSL